MCFLFGWLEPKHEKHADLVKTRELHDVVSDVYNLTRDLHKVVQSKRPEIKLNSCDVLLREVKTASDNTTVIIARGIRVQKK